MKSRQMTGSKEDLSSVFSRKNDDSALDEVLKYNVRFIFELLYQKMKLGSDKLNMRIKQVPYATTIFLLSIRRRFS
jgi:hypothetical protein